MIRTPPISLSEDQTGTELVFCLLITQVLCSLGIERFTTRHCLVRVMESAYSLVVRFAHQKTATESNGICTLHANRHSLI